MHRGDDAPGCQRMLVSKAHASAAIQGQSGNRGLCSSRARCLRNPRLRLDRVCEHLAGRPVLPGAVPVRGSGAPHAVSRGPPRLRLLGQFRVSQPTHDRWGPVRGNEEEMKGGNKQGGGRCNRKFVTGSDPVNTHTHTHTHTHINHTHKHTTQPTPRSSCGRSHVKIRTHSLSHPPFRRPRISQRIAALARTFLESY